MTFAENALGVARPGSVRHDVVLPRRQDYFPSPADWRDETLYFLLVDRFSDGEEVDRPLVDRANLASGRPDAPDGTPWRWDHWAESGGDRWQGGTIAGLESKLDYLRSLGVTTLWLSPIFRQRGHLDSFHGYGIQDFLDVDPRFGTREELVRLVAAAHDAGMRVILDIIFNHSGPNWLYPAGTPGGELTPFYTTGRYPFGAWLGAEGQPIPGIADSDDGVWPLELQDPEAYTRAGAGNLGAGAIDDPDAEHKRTDFITLRDFRLGAPELLTNLARCYKYWIALTDCDGFRIDTVKHVSFEEARNFCGSVKEFAATLGKRNFLLVGEIAGGDTNQERYLEMLERNMDAALDIGEMRLILNGVAKGLIHPSAYFENFRPGLAPMGSHRNIGNRHVSILDDHDHVFGAKIRFASEAASPHQGLVGVALQLFTLGIPCLYYGTEQGLGGPEPAERHWLPGWKSNDRYLREAMFGPRHPRRAGRAGLVDGADGRDPTLPGFGPFGTAGQHCFDDANPIYRRIAALIAARRAFPVLRHGRQYLRPFSFLGRPFAIHGPGELIAWSRILDDEETLVVVNGHGNATRGGDVVVDSTLNSPGATMTVVANSAQAADPQAFSGTHPVGSQVQVVHEDGRAHVAIRDLRPSEVLLLSSHPHPDEGTVVP